VYFIREVDGMSNFENQIKNVLVERGIMLENWKIKITDKKIIGNSDWAKVEVEVFKPRCKKPCITWTLVVNMVKEFVDFEKSTFVRPYN